jgi:hypothetical protein
VNGFQNPGPELCFTIQDHETDTIRFSENSVAVLADGKQNHSKGPGLEIG